MNPLSEGRKSFDQIRQDNNIKFVGVNYSIVGLLILTKEDVLIQTFQFTSEKIDNYK
jgi:hypothetical protein